MINLTQYSLKSSRVTVLFLLLITVLGIVSFLNYPSREDPSITIRNAKVSVQYPGMSPERIENLLTRPVEEKIREIPEVKLITSDSKSGSSLITVTLRDDVPTDEMGAVWQTLRDKMGDITASLPEGTRGPVVNDDLGVTAIATLALWADGFSLQEMEAQADWLRSQLYSLDGVQRIDIFGVQEERIYLEVSRLKLTQYGLDTRQVVDTLSKQNIILPGGQLRVDDRVLVLEPSGNFNSISELEEVVLNIPDSDQLARLGDFAEVKRQYSDPPKSPAYFNGRPALVLSVSINEGINSVAFGEQLKSRVNNLQQQLAIGYVLEFATFQPELVSQAVDGAVNNLYQTLAIVLTVVMVFLGVRTGLIVGSFVPLSMLMGLVIMSVLDV
ncbi:MAG: efflux RND transporter permease subunit, partial [Amphritea sp.]|nr:efflux RND transporter permease subunit [Amphritea sp.]